MNKSQRLEFDEQGGVLNFKPVKHHGFWQTKLFGFYLVVIKESKPTPSKETI